MAKKMTVKEFKQALEDYAEMNFDVWGWEGILNLLIGAHRYTAEFSRKLGGYRVAESDERIANQLQDFLRSKGYYD